MRESSIPYLSGPIDERPFVRSVRYRARMLDWDDGDYEHTAETLVPAAEAVIDVAAIESGMQLLDIGCGTGNAAILAARAGANVIGLDPGKRLLEVARARADREGLTITWRQGDALALPFDDASFDRVVSVFALIFAPDPQRAANELVRVMRPGARAVVTSWCDEGPIAEAGNLLVSALLGDQGANRSGARWGEPDDVRALFAELGVTLTIEERGIAFEAASPTAWFDQQETHHPAWRLGRTQLGDRWPTVRERSIAALTARNEDPSAFRTTSHYLMLTLHRH